MRNCSIRMQVLVTGGAGFIGNPGEFAILDLAHKAIALASYSGT
jgi:nucleoside-diphosphate-sugar epimerase